MPIPSKQANSSNTNINMNSQPQKVTKIRRTRQPKNPQLSVARRNERERNRVKMVNNGFAMLRERLGPSSVEELLETTNCKLSEHQGSGSDTPDTHSDRKQNKKYSKVQTLRAAIERIRQLEQIIYAVDPAFKSLVASSHSASFPADDDSSYCGADDNISIVNSPAELRSQQPQQQQQVYATNQQGQFIRLEPAQLNSLPSPQNSQTSATSAFNGSTGYSPLAASQPTMTQVHFHQQQQQMPQQPPSHTHLWIQQHQNSFIEQQQQVTSSLSPLSQAGEFQPQQQQQYQGQQQHYVVDGQQQLQDSPTQAQQVWYQPQQSAAPPAGFHQHQHQISLYSQ